MPFATRHIRAVLVANSTEWAVVSCATCFGIWYFGDGRAKLIKELAGAPPCFRGRGYAPNSSFANQWKRLWISDDGGVCITFEFLPSIDNELVILILDVLLKHVVELHSIPCRLSSNQASQN